MQMAKEALMDPINIQELVERGLLIISTDSDLKFTIASIIWVLALSGLGGLTTVLDVKIPSTLPRR